MNSLNPMSIRRLVAAAFALSLLGSAACTTTQGTTRASDVNVGAPQVGSANGVAQPQISTRAKLLFEDAVKASEAQAKSGAWDYVSLEKKFRAAANEDPNLAEADYNLGVLAERQGKKQEAVQHYQTALSKKPTLKEAAENLAVIMQNDGNVRGAAEVYQKILASYPDDGSSRARLAEIFLSQGDHERAMQLSREALIREPRTIIAYKVMMRSNLERNQLAMARLVALRALKLDENDPEIYFTIGQILLKENETDKAMLQFKRAIQARADYIPAHVVLAKMAMQNQDYVGAEEHLRRILQSDGKNAEAHLNLGVAYKGMGDFDKAMVAYEAAEKLNPELPGIYLNKGIILGRHKNEPEKAIELYRKYISLKGGEAVADGTVIALKEEAEAVLKAREDEKRAIEEAKRMEAEMKEQQALEERQKRDAEKAKMAEEALKGGDTQPASGTEKKTAAAADEPKAQQKRAAPAKQAAPAPKSSDEPEDDF